MNNLKNKFRIIAVLLVLPFIVLFAGCTEKNKIGDGPTLNPALVNQIKIGQTTQAQVESLLGKPVYSRKSNDKTLMFYNLSQSYKSHDAVELAHPALVGVAGSLA